MESTDVESLPRHPFIELATSGERNTDKLCDVAIKSIQQSVPEPAEPSISSRHGYVRSSVRVPGRCIDDRLRGYGLHSLTASGWLSIL